jgi:hypothetical protein
MPKTKRRRGRRLFEAGWQPVGSIGSGGVLFSLSGGSARITNQKQTKGVPRPMFNFGLNRPPPRGHPPYFVYLP